MGSQWEENHMDCKLWTKEANTEAAKRVVSREKERLHERLEPHYKNTVWEKRSSPPDDWNKPLPDYLKERQDESYLAMYVKYQEKKDQAAESELKMMEVKSKMINSAPSCVIL